MQIAIEDIFCKSEDGSPNRADGADFHLLTLASFHFLLMIYPCAFFLTFKSNDF